MIQRSKHSGVARLSPVTLHNLTRLSEFRKFLIANQDEIVRVTGGYRISWSTFLSSAEIKAMDFRDNNGKPVSPVLAAQIWRRVRKTKPRSIPAGTHPADNPLAAPEFENRKMQPSPPPAIDRSGDHALIVSEATYPARSERQPTSGRSSHAEFAEVLFKRQVRPGSRQDAFVKLVYLDTKGKVNRISDAAMRIARDLSQEDEE